MHPYDDMYKGDGFQYFWAGLTALRVIEAALAAAGADRPRRILDMPCGFGRVTRWLAARFPEASITACDIQPRAVRFCCRRFGVDELISSPSFEQPAFPVNFNLIWCGSLVTHLEAPRVLALLDLLARSARPGGLIVFTTLGVSIADEIKAGNDYMLTADALTAVLQQYERTGFGYADYPWESAYGVSVISPQWIRSHVGGRNGLQEVYHAERGWGGWHDVFAYRNLQSAPSRSMRPG